MGKKKGGRRMSTIQKVVPINSHKKSLTSTKKKLNSYEKAWNSLSKNSIHQLNKLINMDREED
ncbi:hypothetical protein MHB54_27890 [Paenibacillus sp. FSL M7-0802]|uniref:hypothetical protein n=1 Tax=Paenibacillus sp. FSL M7-0802 TaxID=2921536 RepID=UPI0030F96A84